jgi:hypothetical protein
MLASLPVWMLEMTRALRLDRAAGAALLLLSGELFLDFWACEPNNPLLDLLQFFWLCQKNILARSWHNCRYRALDESTCFNFELNAVRSLYMRMRM